MNTPPAESNRINDSKERSKVCIVCGDKALGFNFNAVTCESCKAFFRRNAISSKSFTCPFSSNCEITVITRRFCQKCRLVKCFENGMKKEYIMSEQDKKLKKQKIEQNRLKRRLSTNKASTSGEEDELQSKKQSKSKIIIKNDETVGENPNTEPIDEDPIFSIEPNPDVISINSSPKEIVDSIVMNENSRQKISSLMKTKKEAVEVMEKIVKSPEDALILISHLIANPADALVILQKIMDSPFNAISIFNQFFSSSTDAFSVITKIMSSPNEILSFMRQLMIAPNDALEILNKLVCTPGESLETMNSGSIASSFADSMIKSMLDMSGNISSPISDNSYPTSITFQKTSNECLSSSYCDPNNTCFTDSNNNGKSPIKTEHLSAFRKMTSDLTDEVLKDVESYSDPKSSIDSIISEAIKLEYDVPFSASQRSSRELSDTEQAKLNELIISNKALYQPVDEDLASLISEECKVKSDPDQLDSDRTSETLMNVINLTAVAIRRLIKMSKKISAFKNMCQECQIALLKAGCTEMMILRSVMQYDCDRASWKIPHSNEGMSNIKAEVLKLAKGNVYEEHDRFIRSFDPKLKSDENVILILCAIVLFTPTRPKVLHADVIRLEQNSYFYLLRRYLDSQYPNGCESKAIFLKLIQKINELHKLNDEMISVYLNVNPTQVEPLLREIFDLKVL